MKLYRDFNQQMPKTYRFWIHTLEITINYKQCVRFFLPMYPPWLDMKVISLWKHHFMTLKWSDYYLQYSNGLKHCERSFLTEYIICYTRLEGIVKYRQLLWTASSNQQIKQTQTIDTKHSIVRNMDFYVITNDTLMYLHRLMHQSKSSARLTFPVTT